MSIISRLVKQAFKFNPLSRIKLKQLKPYSRLMIVPAGGNWSVDWDATELKGISTDLNIPLVDFRYESQIKNQSIFYASRYHILTNWVKPTNRVGFPYFHGKPQSDISYKKMINIIKIHHDEINRIQVTHSEIHDIILETGIDVDKVFLIPIGINLKYFNWTTSELRSQTRLKLGIPQSAVVIGSFQKDGHGWGDGMKPKLIKGPDIFLKTVKILKDQVSELYVLLTGPARGYIKQNLEKLNVPYAHTFLNDYTKIGQYYNALDMYIISSREEGGPKAVLESMASGIPLVTTKVGQAMDLVKHGENAWMVEQEDAEGLAHWSMHAIEASESIDESLKNGQKIAEKNSYKAQIPLWRKLMNGFVNL